MADKYEAMRKRLSSRFERKKKENEAFNKAITASYIRMKSICIGCKASFQSMKEHLETSDKCLSEYGKLFVNELNPRFTLSEVDNQKKFIIIMLRCVQDISQRLN